MKNWYKSNLTKGILIILEHIFAVVLVVCMLFVFMYPGQVYGGALKNLSKIEYADTKGFEGNMLTAAHEIAWQIEREENFETDGVYDPDKLVDIKAYAKDWKITGENVSGLAYRLGDLKKWSENYVAYGEQPNIVVCRKPDNTYDYYEVNEFAKRVKTGEFTIWRDNNEEYLQALEEGSVYENSYEKGATEIINANRETVYTEFWNFDYAQAVVEEIPTVSGKTLMQIANEEPEWNGKLSEMYDYLYRALTSLSGEVESYENAMTKWAEGNTNCTFLFADFKNKRLYSNRQAYQDIEKVSSYVEQIKGNERYVIAAPKLVDFETNINATADNWCLAERNGTDDYLCLISVDTDYPIQDSFYMQNKAFEQYAPYMMTAVWLAVISALGFFIALVWLTAIAGRTTKDDGVTLVWFDRLKTELGAATVVIIWACVVALINDGIHSYRVTVLHVILYGIIAVISCAAFLGGYLSLVRRIKAKTLWKNSVLRWFIQVIKKFLQYRSCTFKVTLAMLAFLMIHWFAFVWLYTRHRSVMVLVFVVEAFAFYFVLRKAIERQKIKKGIVEISKGNVNYQIPLDGLKGDELEIATCINHIGEGLNKAVEQSMKDERLKTDLITNVSHDIKTPLTSIINYVDLLKRENIQDPKIQGYLEILDVKSQRLKQLTEDVVEASKISSGNITMEYMNINFVEMINQTTGEFDEKFAKRNLNVVLNVPDHPVMIRSDGRRMWRVIENIYNNAAKYALENTRVYADLIEHEDIVEFSLKNISEQPLNITADELTERFIRGDVSRSTEGSGLGLSIAKSLTQMQGGKFNLYLDGDLFKVTIEFPKVIESR